MWTKICGITTISDAVNAARIGVDAIGLNFYPRSKRFVDPTTAAELMASIRNCDERILCVGVFVNATLAEICEVTDRNRLHCVQFHGDESEDLMHAFHQARPEVSIIRAFRARAENLSDLLESVRHLSSRIPLKACLLDAHVGDQYGGTGCRLDRDVARRYLLQRDMPPMILAGGLTDKNVMEAILDLGPWGVDTASGVEVSPGIKNADLMLSFVRNARRAFLRRAGSASAEEGNRRSDV
jgi:phosphoribosylanthranilate isomerase